MPAIHRSIESGKNETQDKNEITKIERKMRETDAPKNMTNSKRRPKRGKHAYSETEATSDKDTERCASPAVIRQAK